MRQGESAEDSALATEDQHLFGDGDGAYDVLGFFGVVVLIHIVDLVDVGFVVNEKTDFSTHFAISDLRGRFEHC